MAVQIQASAQQRFPDVVAAKAIQRSGDLVDFDVTVSSPYDTAQRCADAFRVMDKAGKVYGERVLAHDHADEQPFTRDLYGVNIPKNIKKWSCKRVITSTVMAVRRSR